MESTAEKAPNGAVTSLPVDKPVLRLTPVEHRRLLTFMEEQRDLEMQLAYVRRRGLEVQTEIATRLGIGFPFTVTPDGIVIPQAEPA